MSYSDLGFRLKIMGKIKMQNLQQIYTLGIQIHIFIIHRPKINL